MVQWAPSTVSTVFVPMQHLKQTRFALSRLVLIAVGAKANSTMVESQHHGCMLTNTVSARPWQKAPMHNAPIALPCPHAPMQNGISSKAFKNATSHTVHVAAQSTVAIGQLAVKLS